jgi:hypothetical protein
MARHRSWVDSWFAAAQVFSTHDALAYAGIADSLAEAPVPNVPERPLVVLAALRRAALQGRATDPHAGDVEAPRDDLHRLIDEITDAAEVDLVQYTDPVRLGDILPGLWCAALWYPDRPLRLVELGASAGMLLLAESITVRFTTGAWAPPGTLGAIDYPMEIPPEFLSTPLAIESSIGIDLRPLDMRDPEHVELLHSYAWPGPSARKARLDLGIRVAHERPPLLVEGDVMQLAPDIIRGSLDRAAVTVVFDSAFSHYLSTSSRVKLGRMLDALCGAGPLVMISRGASVSGDSGRSAVRAIDLTGRRRKVYAEMNIISESPEWLAHSSGISATTGKFK